MIELIIIAYRNEKFMVKYRFPAVCINNAIGLLGIWITFTSCNAYDCSLQKLNYWYTLL